MSEVVGLGDADAESRWVGIRRHQAALCILGIGLTGDWVIESHAQSFELVLGLGLFVMALPASEGLTVGEFLGVASLFGSRSRWLVVHAEANGRSLSLRARGVVHVIGFELVHRGRLDLAGSDFELAQRFADLTKSLATGGEVDHVSIHVRSDLGSARTLLALHASDLSPEGWHENADLLRSFLDLGANSNSSGLLERWGYLRRRHEVLRVYRLRDFSGVDGSRAVLEKIQQSRCHPEVALHVDVLTNERAQRVASRAVHRMGSDHAASSAIGFRRSARSKRSLLRLSQREEFVASGEALLRLAVFLTVRASSLVELRARSRELQKSCKESGLRVERGGGRQLAWYCFQLPGGPGW
ncbi:MAG: hypothetical protein WAN30_02960 [Acidimicrobiales bacterium]